MPTEGFHLSSLDSVEAHCWAVGTVLYTLLAAVDHLADGAEQGFWARVQRALQACRTTLWAEAFGSVAAVLSLVPYYADKGPLGERLRRLAGGAPPPPPLPSPNPSLSAGLLLSVAAADGRRSWGAPGWWYPATTRLTDRFCTPRPHPACCRQAACCCCCCSPEPDGCCARPADRGRVGAAACGSRCRPRPAWRTGWRATACSLASPCWHSSCATDTPTTSPSFSG